MDEELHFHGVQSGPPPECGGPIRATPGTFPSGTGPWNVSPAHVRPSAPVRERQHVIAKARSPRAARLAPPPSGDPNGATRESRLERAASGGRRGPPPQGPIGATSRMRGPNEGHPRNGSIQNGSIQNGSLERVSGTCSSECASQRAPTCDFQEEVAASGPVGATPQVVTRMGPPVRVAAGGPMGAIFVTSNRGRPANGPIGATPRTWGAKSACVNATGCWATVSPLGANSKECPTSETCRAESAGFRALR